MVSGRFSNICMTVDNLILVLLLFVDMRKALKRDKKKESVVPLKEPITPDQLEW